MDDKKKFLWIVMFLPWLTFPFLGKQTVKRFSIASIAIGILFGVQSVIAHRRGWWRVYPRLHPKIMGELPFIIGPFYIGALWILKFAYGKFMRYTLLNLGVDFFHIYIFVTWLRKMGIASLIRLKNYQALILFTFNAVLMYYFQRVFDNIIKPKKPKSWTKRILS